MFAATAGAFVSSEPSAFSGGVGGGGGGGDLTCMCSVMICITIFLQDTVFAVLNFFLMFAVPGSGT